MSTVFLIAALALVSVWTSRLAKVKGRNPWLWGGASFVLGIPTVHLFAVVPLIIIMFLKSPQQQAEGILKTTDCPKCQATTAVSSRYCTKCGWELARVVTLDTPQEAEAPITIASTQTEEPPEVAQRPDQVLAESEAVQHQEVVNSPAAVPVADSTSEPAVEQPATTDSAAATADAQMTDDDVTNEAATEEMPAPISSYRKPIPVDAPTATAMTERGVQLFNQGRTQEAIDQFTKAIALDAGFIEAWAKRAEAYALLGRGDQAAEDQRRLDSLNASSS
ncbi:MAG TPA: hypothetical protein EYM38_06235 [Dehalococcoidia bacterium]|nr:hypothetical protein [Dehalococcoidia bacterium]